MLDWLFSWPPTPTEFIVSLGLAALLGWQWGRIFMARRFNRELEAHGRAMRASNERLDQMMREPAIPGQMPTLAQMAGRTGHAWATMSTRPYGKTERCVHCNVMRSTSRSTLGVICAYGMEPGACFVRATEPPCWISLSQFQEWLNATPVPAGPQDALRRPS